MQKSIKALTLASVLAFAQAAWAGNNNGGHNNNGHNDNGPTITHINNNGNRGGGTTNNDTSLTANQQQTATGIGIGTGISSSTSGAISGSQSSATVGPITNGASASTGPITNGASATTGPISNNSSATGGTAISNATGGTSNATGGTSNATGGSVGPMNVAPQQSTVNSFRSFVGTNAPNLSGSVDNCLAVLGWSAAVNVFGATGVGLGGGNQRTEYVEQCAAVKSAFEVWNRANGDINKETFAIEMLIKALPTYGKPAMEAAVGRINSYIEQNGDQEPDSVMNIFGAKAFRKKEVAAETVPPVVLAPAAQPNNVTVVVNPVVERKETRVIVAEKKKQAQAQPKKPDCGCKQ